MRFSPLLSLGLLALLGQGCVFHVGGDRGFEVSSWNAPRSARTHNRERLEQLAVGMSLEDAKQHMGSERQWLGDAVGWIEGPYRTEGFQNKQGEAVVVLLYYTDLRRRDDVIADDELTPLVFQGGTLRGWGWPYYHQVVNGLEAAAH